MALVLAIIGAACIVYGIAIMSLWSGTWFFAVWYALGAILIGVGWALHSGAWEQAPVAIKRTLEIAGCALLACVIVFGGMALSGFGQQGEDDLDYIVVLGAQVYEDHPSVVLQYRLDMACDYLRKNEDTVCIVSGGKGMNEPRAEADVMGEYLESRGVPASRIIREGASLNTTENIVNSMEIIAARSASESAETAEGNSLPSPERARVGIVTNDFHVFRGVGIARKKGMSNACGIAALSNPWYLPNNLFREALSIAKDFVQGNL